MIFDIMQISVISGENILVNSLTSDHKQLL